MKTYRSYLHIFLVTGLLGFGACKTSINTPAPSRGTADFTRYIAVGNSLTAGYADGGLYREGQLNSYPSIIAAQMQKVGGGTFTQPLFSTDQANGSGYLKLTALTNGVPTTEMQPATGKRGEATVPGFGTVTLYTKYKGDINNYGVPLIKLQQITFGQLGNLNGYFERMLPTDFPTNVNSTYLDFVTAKPYTFFTDWLGNNDALLYAITGGADPNLRLTDKAQFSQLYNLSITQLTKSGQKGAVATIPDVVAVPYFNTVTVGAILAGVQKVNPAAKALYVNALNADGSHSARIATAADLIILSFPTSMMGQPVAAAGNLPYGLTPLTPIEDKYVLDQGEVAMTQDYVNAYNATIKSVASSKGLAIFDAYAFLNDVKAHGLVVDGVNLSSAFISGGIFSLDGIHLTPRGYAVVANEFIKAINKQYNASIPLANVSSYRGVKFP
ncbi:G-D-S-L family lipolytic protein [Mucilaginibacter sp. NFX135]|uniref:G-D-S-L family lipolytic protein n=1 Tax=Mucilaginibacter sp. NFX135 TaxID=3402687 RepID=UPI003AFA8ABE